MPYLIETFDEPERAQVRQDRYSEERGEATGTRAASKVEMSHIGG